MLWCHMQLLDRLGGHSGRNSSVDSEMSRAWRSMMITTRTVVRLLLLLRHRSMVQARRPFIVVDRRLHVLY